MLASVPGYGATSWIKQEHVGTFLLWYANRLSKVASSFVDKGYVGHKTEQAYSEDCLLLNLKKYELSLSTFKQVFGKLQIIREVMIILSCNINFTRQSIALFEAVPTLTDTI